MRQKRHKPPPENRYIIIKQSAAIPNNGIAALLRSTGFYSFTFVSVYVYGICHTRLFVIRQMGVFLFALTLDKPCLDRPRCRSPPLSICFAQKTDWRKGL